MHRRLLGPLAVLVAFGVGLCVSSLVERSSHHGPLSPPAHDARGAEVTRTVLAAGRACPGVDVAAIRVDCESEPCLVHEPEADPGHWPLRACAAWPWPHAVAIGRDGVVTYVIPAPR